MTDPEEICQKIHRYLQHLPFYHDPSEVPFIDGLYLFYEDGEASVHGPAPEGRIVRVGNHPNRNGHLVRRLRQHYTGNKNCSIFRKYMGGALIRKDDRASQCLRPGPGKGHWEKANAKSCALCKPYEKKVSDYIRGHMGFRCVYIPDMEERNLWEKKLIATLSSCDICTASRAWFGSLTYSKKIRASGMWNHTHVDDRRFLMDGHDVAVFEEVIDNTFTLKDKKTYPTRPISKRGGHTMIPDKIRRKHIVRAIEDIRKGGVRPMRKSQKYCLDFEDGHYPPKYVISLAATYAIGHELHHDDFNGGHETNSFLESKGFTVVMCGFKCGGTRH